MDNLKPGTKYIYEHADGITYAREFGALHCERFEIGRTVEKQSLINDLRNQKLWGNIHRAAKINHLLREALERVIMLYHLSRQHDKEI